MEDEDHGQHRPALEVFCKLTLRGRVYGRLSLLAGTAVRRAGWRRAKGGGR